MENDGANLRGKYRPKFKSIDKRIVVDVKFD